MTCRRSHAIDATRPLGAIPRAAALSVAAVSAASLLLQYALLLRLEQQGVGPWLATLRFLSYFTILSNLLVVAVALSWGRARPRGRPASARAAGAAALYIGFTGGIYLVVLRHLWQPQGWQGWADSGLHYAAPALYLCWWLLAVPHGALRWRDAAAWLAFPLVYLAWTALRGAWVGEYPYPFIDVVAIGWAAAARNAGAMALLFVAGGLALVAIDRVLAVTAGSRRLSGRQ